MRIIAVLLTILFFTSTALADIGINCRVQSETSGPIAPGDRQVAIDVACAGGLVLTGGGESCGLDPETIGVDVISTSYPQGDPTEWYCSWENQTLLTVNCSCDAICCTMTPPGPQAPVVCDHDECLQGIALDAGCSTCVDTVCACDSFCCDNQWDSYCVHEAQQLCGLTCNSTATCLAECGCPAPE